MEISQQCQKFCQIVANTPDITNATVRTGVWLLGVASELGGFPVELTYRQIRDGFEINNKHIPGTGSRHETIKSTLQWLEEAKLLSHTAGSKVGFGHTSRHYSMSI